jgi:hypothetical protein
MREAIRGVGMADEIRMFERRGPNVNVVNR